MKIPKLRHLGQVWTSGWRGSSLHPVIGIDIGSQAITFAKIQNRQSRLRLDGWGCRKFDTPILERGRIRNQSVLIEGLRALVEEYGIRGAYVAMAVNGASVMVKRVHVPQCDRKNLDEFLIWEGPRYIPYDPDDVYLDFALSPSVSPNSSKEGLDLLLVVSKREAVDERRTLLEEVGLNPLICDLDALAFYNLASIHRDVQSHRAYILVYLQPTIMHVVVVACGEPLLIRDVDFLIDMKLGDQPGKSDVLDQKPKPDDPPEFSSENSSMWEELLGMEVLGELKRTLDGAREIQPDLKVEAVFFSSSLRIRDAFQNELSQGLMIPVFRIDALESLRQNRGLSSEGSFLNIACGLALRSPYH